MDSKIDVFELQDDKTVKKQTVTLTFPRPNNARLYIITNQRSNCHFLQNPEEQQSFQKTPGIGKTSEEKKLFQYGVSTKVFSVTDSTGTKWEVRLLLSPSEIARLSSACNLIGYLSTHLVCRESHGAFEKLDGKKSSKAAKEIFRGISPFLCLPLESDKVEDFCTQLRKIVNLACKDLCGDVALMVAGGLAALVAAELAASMVDSDMFDYAGEKAESKENQDDQIRQMISEFNVQAEELAIVHQQKTVHIIFRNPCPDNWASGGRICADSGETFEFGLCHKIFSIGEAHCEIQFLQSLQASYDMVAVFHIAGFAERLLMTKKWRKTLDILLKEGQKEAINELSQLAAEFVCSNKCDVNIFQKCFKKEMTEKLSKLKTLQGGEEVICVFGVLVAITAALKAKSVAENPIGDLDLSDEDAEPPRDAEPKEDPDCENIGLPKTESGYPKPLTIGLNLGENDNTVNEEATRDIGGIPRGVADGFGDGEREGFVSVYHPDTGTSPPYPDDGSHPCDGDNQVNIGIMDTSGTLDPSSGVLPAVEPQDLTNITTTIGNCKDDREDPYKVDTTYRGSSEEGVPSYVHDTESGSRTTSDEETLAKATPSRTTLESSYIDPEKTANHSIPLEPKSGVLPAVEPQDLAKITANVISDNCKDDREDSDEVSATTYLGSSEESVLSRAHDTESGPMTTHDEDTKLSNPTSNLESSGANLQKAIIQDTPKLDGNGGESLTTDSQNDLSDEKSLETKELEVDQVGQKQDHPLGIDLGREETSNGRGATHTFLILLVIIIVALAIALFVVPSGLKTAMFTGLALIVGLYLFLNRRP